MADVKISQLNDGSPAQSADEIPVTRGASNFKISAGDIADLVIGNLTASKPVFTNSDSELVSTGTVPLNQGGTGATTASNARTNLGLGSVATQDASSIAITGGSIAGITDLAVADGGTGASTAAGARTNLLPSYASNATKVLRVNAGATDVEWAEQSASGVTSVAAGTGLSGGTITSTGTIALATAYGDTVNPYASKTANYVLAAPNGSSGVPTFRALVAADIPTLNQSTSGNAATATALQTARTINGVSFDGTANITVAAVTSVGLTMPSGFSVASSPVTSSGTIAVTTSLSGILKGNGSGFTTATSGTDYAPATSGTSILYGNGSGGFSNVTVGTGLSFSAGTLSATGAGGSGDVVGPSSATDNQIALFDSTTGKLIKAASTSGLLKASSGVIAAATSGTDYAPATSGTSILKGSGSGGFSNASAGSDYLAPPSGTAILKANSGGALANATAGTDYLAPPSGTSLLKANSGGALANATAGTDYAAATTGTNAQLLANNGSGGFSNVTVGSGLSYSAGTLTATGGGSGTVTSVDVSGGTTGLTTSGGPITSSGTITLAGTLAVANGGTGITSFGSGIATWLGTPSSANLAAAVSDETGTGALVFANTPTLVTPVLGTPTSGNLSNCTVDGTNKVGYIGAPQSTNTTVAASDAGKHIYFTGGSTATLTVNLNATTPIDVGTTILVVNNNSGSLTISGAGVTFQLANGATGNRTVATKGMATLLKVATDTWYVSGAGVT
jgi:hypothetical protein